MTNGNFFWKALRQELKMHKIHKMHKMPHVGGVGHALVATENNASVRCFAILGKKTKGSRRGILVVPDFVQGNKRNSLRDALAELSS